MPRSIRLLFALVFLIAPELHAQSPGHDPALFELSSGARAMALGAQQIGVADSDHFLVHPALVRAGGGMRLGWARFGDGGGRWSLSSTTSWFGGSISIGLGLESLEYRGAEPGTRPGGMAPLFGSGDVGRTETAAALAVGTRFAGFDVGTTVRAVTLRADASRRTLTTADVGVSRSLGDIRAAFSVRGFGPEVTLGGEEIDLPPQVVLGLGAYGARLGPLDVGMAAEVAHRGDGEVIGGGGLELSWWPIAGRTFTARVGYRSSPEGDVGPVGVGGSYRGDSIVFDWGWRPVDGTDGVHTVSIGWR